MQQDQKKRNKVVIFADNMIVKEINLNKNY